jgi:hypothetical protein
VTALAVQPGDVLVVRTTGWAAEMIRLGEALEDKPNVANHVAVADHADANGTLWGVEGRPGGVGWVDLAAYLASSWTTSNAAQPKTDEQRRLVTVTMRGMLGDRYDWEAIAADAAEDLHLGELWLPDHGLVRGETVCSALAAYGHDKAGLPRPPGRERTVQPSNWEEWCLTRGWERFLPARVVPEAGEPLVRLDEPAVPPESPWPGPGAGDDQGPGAIPAGDDRVPVQGATEPDGPGPQDVVPGRRPVSVAAPEHDGEEPPGVVVEGAVIVGLQPVVDPH